MISVPAPTTFVLGQDRPAEVEPGSFVVLNMESSVFRLSHAAMLRLAELKGLMPIYFTEATTNRREGLWQGRQYYTIPEAELRALKADSPELAVNFHFYEGSLHRNDPDLLQVVRELGDAAHLDGNKLA